jgi:hypothetical protein
MLRLLVLQRGLGGLHPVCFLLHGNITGNLWLPSYLQQATLALPALPTNLWHSHNHTHVFFFTTRNTRFSPRYVTAVKWYIACLWGCAVCVPSLTGCVARTADLSEAPRGWAKYNGRVGSYHTVLLAILQQNTAPSVLSQVRSLYWILLIFSAYCRNCLKLSCVLLSH